MSAFSVKPLLLALVMWQAAGAQSTESPAVSPNDLRYERSLTLDQHSGAASSQACVVLDSGVFAHSAPSLKDLRLFRGLAEVPYAVTLSESLQQDSEDARILNLGAREGRIVFDLEMPHRPYTEVTLDLAAKDFIATAIVSGEDEVEAKKVTTLGNFTLFDLSSQRLSHSTNIPLPESSFPYLHVELAMSASPRVAADSVAADTRILQDPAIVKSANVPPSREAQTVYTTVAQTASLSRRGRQSVATFQVPLRVPVERISFDLPPGFKGNFSREIEVKANASSKPDAPNDTVSEPEDESPPRQESLAGTISRVHATEAGRELTEEQLSLPAAIGSNMQRPAAIEVAIDNGDDQPLPIATVRLEMRQRRICFDPAVAGTSLNLDYGDAELDAPVYDYAKLFQPVAAPLAANLGAETLNVAYQPPKESRPFTERHPELLWIGLLAVVCILALTAIRSAKKLH